MDGFSRFGAVRLWGYVARCCVVASPRLPPLLEKLWPKALSGYSVVQSTSLCTHIRYYVCTYVQYIHASLFMLAHLSMYVRISPYVCTVRPYSVHLRTCTVHPWGTAYLLRTCKLAATPPSWVEDDDGDIVRLSEVMAPWRMARRFPPIWPVASRDRFTPLGDHPIGLPH